MKIKEYLPQILGISMGMIAFMTALFVVIGRVPKIDITNGTSDLHPLYAQIISTNLVSVPCQCGFCRPSEGVRVPEHINRIGYDLKVVVSTSYYPIVSRPIN